ncbi:MAG: hypothetical protein PHY30_02600 [Candidatus Pacebacteria bacterium]|nr:hypothetical protein [Candidatus Paceibacterota bacterium]
MIAEGCCSRLKKCVRCGKIGTKNDALEFSFLSNCGFDVMLVKQSFICPKCAEEEWNETFKNCKAKNFLSKKNGKIIIDWSKYWKMIFEEPERQTIFNKILFDINIFSFNEMHYKICIGSEPLIKGVYNTFYYVKSRKNALDCANAFPKKFIIDIRGSNIRIKEIT